MITHTFIAKLHSRCGYTPVHGEIEDAKTLPEAIESAAALLRETPIHGDWIELTVRTRKPKKKEVVTIR